MSNLRLYKIMYGKVLSLEKALKQPKCPSTEEWIEKMWYNSMDYYSAIKKNKIMPFAVTWIDLESVRHSEVRRRRRNVIWHPLYMESKKKCYKWSYKTERDSRLRKWTYGCQGEGIVRSLGRSCTHCYIKIELDGRGAWGRIDIHICMYSWVPSLFT